VTPTPNSLTAESMPSHPESVARPVFSPMVRVAIYAHVIAVALTWLGMTHDTRSVAWSEQWIPFVAVCLPFGALALIVCPVVLLIGLVRSVAPLPDKVMLLGLEGIILFAHLVALIPSIQ